MAARNARRALRDPQARSACRLCSTPGAIALRAPRARATSGCRGGRGSARSVRRGRQRAPRREEGELLLHRPALADERLRPERGFARRAVSTRHRQARDLRADPRATSLTPVPSRSSHSRAAAIVVGPRVVGGFEIPAAVRERRRSGSADGLRERARRVAQALEPAQLDDPVVGERERARAAASAGGPRDCRCPPTRHRAAAAACRVCVSYQL